MAFVQIIDFRSSRFEEGRTHVEAYLAATEGRRTVRRSLVCQDRDDPQHYLNIVFFDSFESAMENSQLPETNELSVRLAELTDGEPSFLNLDVIEDQEG